MRDLVVVGIAGFAAAFVDGALGMGFGPTSSSILLSSGVSPTAVSATVNLAKVATGIVSGASHWRLGNVDRLLAARLAGPGVAGALVGTFILTMVDGERLRPILALLLIAVGIRILLRFRSPVESRPPGPRDEPLRGVALAGAAGGVTNGLIGAWGPVVTPFLLHRGIAPRLVVGSVNAAEIAVAVVSAGSLINSNRAGVDLATLGAMLGGGIIAAPFAAYTVRFVPARLLGLAVAGLLLLTNTIQLAEWAEVGSARWLAYATVGALVVWASVRPRLLTRRANGEPVRTRAG